MDVPGQNKPFHKPLKKGQKGQKDKELNETNDLKRQLQKYLRLAKPRAEGPAVV